MGVIQRAAGLLSYASGSRAARDERWTHPLQFFPTKTVPSRDRGGASHRPRQSWLASFRVELSVLRRNLARRMFAKNSVPRAPIAARLAPSVSC